jgi:alpha-tubulin suppressor-like RCC1 family protein
MRRSRALGFCVGLASFAWIVNCRDGTGIDPCPDGTSPPCDLSADGVILSDPAPGDAALAQTRPPHGLAFSFAAQVTSAEDDVAYISLPSQSYPGGAIARVTSSSFEGTVTAPMIEGGLDPVPVSATAGDSVEIEILSSDLVALARTGSKVPATRRPRVVRTVPPRGKTDVAVNAIIVVIFSEPIDAGSLSSSSIRLLRNGSPVAGTARLLEGVTAAVAFQPSEPLNPNAAYTLQVTQGVRDLDGDALEAEVEVGFTSGTQFAPFVSRLTVIPDVTALAVGSQVQLLARAMSGDDTLRAPVPIEGVPILWETENPAVARVSSTGLVTAIAGGEVRIRAQVLSDQNVSASGRIMVSGTLTPVATVEVSPASDTTPVTGKIELTAVMRDSSGNVVEFRPVSWSTTNTAVATVEPASGGKAWVTGVSSGTTSIIANSDGEADTVTVDVVNPGPYTTLSAGGVSNTSITCGLRAGGWAFCWGGNAAGQVGDGTSNSSGLAHAVVGALRFSQLSAGGNNTCAVTAQGEAYCWGSNRFGSLGIGTVVGPELCEFAGSCSRRPIAVFGGHSFTEVHVGHGSAAFVCGLTSGGAAYCWGDNFRGMLGNGSTTGPEACMGYQGTPTACSTVPIPVAGGRLYTTITLGGAHACALTNAGEAYCWGVNDRGQLGDGTTTDRSVPVAVAGGLTFTAIGAGVSHTCGVATGGSAYCWGRGITGALGHGTFADIITAPVRVSGSELWTAISGGEDHTCALASAGSAYCWGANYVGQLGIGTTQESSTPVPVVGGLTFVKLTTGGSHSCGLTTASVAHCWGTNDRFVPVRVEGQP